MPAASLVVLLVVAAVPAAVGQALPLGMGRITLQGRQNCPQGGELGTERADSCVGTLSHLPGLPHISCLGCEHHQLRQACKILVCFLPCRFAHCTSMRVSGLQLNEVCSSLLFVMQCDCQCSRSRCRRPHAAAVFHCAHARTQHCNRMFGSAPCMQARALLPGILARTCRKSNSLSLSPGAATTLSTWIIDRAQALLPGDVGVPVNFKASQQSKVAREHYFGSL